MKNIEWVAFATVIVLVALLLPGAFKVTTAASGAWRTAELTKDDCIKCHSGIIRELKAGNSKHQTDVECLDCHAGPHPPKGSRGEMIPSCAQCHEDAPHFTLPRCLVCHRNPHQPLKIELEGEGHKPACGTCHPDTVEEINTHRTSHTGFACSYCHKQHRDRPNCLDCHGPHWNGQVFADCIKCHQAHQPLTLTYADDSIANEECGACHQDIREALKSGKTGHSRRQCVFCHDDRHGNIPGCRECHEGIHDRAMIQNFASCNGCHQSAHELLK